MRGTMIILFSLALPGCLSAVNSHLDLGEVRALKDGRISELDGSRRVSDLVVRTYDLPRIYDITFLKSSDFPEQFGERTDTVAEMTKPEVGIVTRMFSEVLPDLDRSYTSFKASGEELILEAPMNIQEDFGRFLSDLKTNAKPRFGFNVRVVSFEPAILSGWRVHFKHLSSANYGRGYALFTIVDRGSFEEWVTAARRNSLVKQVSLPVTGVGPRGEVHLQLLSQVVFPSHGAYIEKEGAALIDSDCMSVNFGITVSLFGIWFARTNTMSTMFKVKISEGTMVDRCTYMHAGKVVLGVPNIFMRDLRGIVGIPGNSSLILVTGHFGNHWPLNFNDEWPVMLVIDFGRSK